MTYDQVLTYMYEKLPMFHRIGSTAYKANLDTAIFLDNLFHHPHQTYRTIHVAGTNGKGSVSHMLAAILQKAGYKTGLFTSPHLKDFRERIRINGEMITEAEVIAFIEAYQTTFDQVKPSFFEMTSALAFYYFSKESVDIAIIEVGMGGRLDSTNIITPLVSVITNIGLDHTEFLGNTLDKIAAEKAGIIKDNVPVVIGEYHEETWPVFTGIANQRHSPIILSKELFEVKRSVDTNNQKQTFDIYRNGNLVYPALAMDLLGLYQQKNICTVLAVVDNLKTLSISKEAIYSGLADVAEITGLQGRWQTIGLNPLIVCDTGHNKDGIAWVVQQLNTVTFDQLHMVIGFVKDKNIDDILALLPTKAIYYFTNASIPRALDANELKTKALNYNLNGECYPSVTLALEAAKKNAKENDFIFVGGSNFVVGEAI